MNRLGRLTIMAAAISLAAVGATAAPARSAAGLAPAATTSFAINGCLYSVAAISATDAWAVGFSGVDKAGCYDGPLASGVKPVTLIVHWNGTKWSQVTSPKPVPGALFAVTAVSADNAWAVGIGTGGSLVMHWNGKAWSRQGGVPAVHALLYTVAASGSSVWAAGEDGGSPVSLHRTGNRWYVVPFEAPAHSVSANPFFFIPFFLLFNFFDSIVVTGGGTTWGSGEYVQGGFVMRWNGAAWKSVSNPMQGGNYLVTSLFAGPGGALWAVGAEADAKLDAVTAVSMLWNGKTWRMVPAGSPVKNTQDVPVSATFFPGGTAWAVGWITSTSSSNETPLILRWTGRAWIRVAPPGESSNSGLYGIAATSASSAWAVGYVSRGSQPQTLILHWNGETWS